MNPILVLVAVAFAETPLAVDPLEWSKVARAQPDATQTPSAWVADTVRSSGHDGGDAALAVGGFVAGAECQSGAPRTCEVAVRWSVRDRLVGSVRYTALTRGLGPDLEAATRDATARLLERSRFKDALASALLLPDTRPPILVRRCTAEPKPLPAGMRAALAGTVFVKTGAGTGSGVVISPDGLVLTAAHVVADEGSVEVRSQGGEAASAKVLAVDRRQDVALLQAEGAERPCLPVAAGAADVGTELYAIGSPLGEALEFSVSKGIVSGARRAGDVRFLQTDASLNPGNSGGPLVGLDGRLLAVVSWKVAAEGLEGLGFGVPIDAAMQSLGLQWGDTTSVPAERGPTAARPEVDTIRDTDDEPRLGAKGASSTAKAGKPPTTALVVGGVLLGAIGGAGVLGTYLSYQDTPQMTQDEWTLLQVANTASWVAVAGGGAMLLTPAFLSGPGIAVKGSF